MYPFMGSGRIGVEGGNIFYEKKNEGGKKVWHPRYRLGPPLDLLETSSGEDKVEMASAFLASLMEACLPLQTEPVE